MRYVSTPTSKLINGARQEFSFGRWFILGLSCTILIFAPLAYASVHPWAYFSLGLTSVALSMLLLAKGLYDLWISPDRTVLLPRPPLWGAVVGVTLLVFLQIMPLPQTIVGWISPVALKIRSLGNGYGLANYVPISLNPYATTLASLKFWPALVFFYVLLYTVNSREQLKTLVGTILVIALIEIIYGFWHFHNHMIWGWKNPYAEVGLYGTFINRNHLAAYLTMSIFLGFGLFLAQKEAIAGLPRGLPDRRFLRHCLQQEYLEPLFRRYFMFFLSLLLSVALIFTGSRAGMVSLIAGFVLMGLLMGFKGRQKGHLYPVLFFLVTVMLYSLWLGSASFIKRLVDLGDEGRYQAFHGAFALFREFPWTGTGIGNFGELFYRFEPANPEGIYFIYAHNDWLQLLAEAGILGFCLMAGAWLAFFARLVREWRRRQDYFAWGLGLGGLAALAAGAFHALGEFPFHIPAYSLTYASVAAVTYLVLYQHQPLNHFSYPMINLSSNRGLATCILLAMLGVQLVYITQVFHHWRAELAAPTEIDSIRKARPLGVADFRRALTLNSENSLYHLGLAEALETEGVLDPEGLLSIEKSFQEAIRRAPANWVYHLKLGEFYLRHYRRDQSRYMPRAVQEFAAAVNLFPDSGYLHFRLSTILSWMELCCPEFIPLQFRGSYVYYLNKALKLAPELH